MLNKFDFYLIFFINKMGNCINYKNQTDIKDDSSLISFKTCKVFIPPITSGKVIKVYDGDTITIATKVPGLEGSEVYKFSIRLNGIDTPEIKTKNDEEKKIAKIAQSELYNKIYDKIVTLKNVKLEKYGRLLCDVYCEEIYINDWLLNKR